MSATKYRLLTEVDTIQVGDEMLLDDCVTWERINGGPSIGESWMIGRRWSVRVNVPMRRAVAAVVAGQPCCQCGGSGGIDIGFETPILVPCPSCGGVVKGGAA